VCTRERTHGSVACRVDDLVEILEEDVPDGKLARRLLKLLRSASTKASRAETLAADGKRRSARRMLGAVHGRLTASFKVVRSKRPRRGLPPAVRERLLGLTPRSALTRPISSSRS
jgi:hypothetical protein